jgi:hypothetical protein
MLVLSRRINNDPEEDMRWEAGRRGAIVGIRFPSGCEQRFSCQDQIARSFNGIKSLHRGVLELICASETSFTKQSVGDYGRRAEK